MEHRKIIDKICKCLRLSESGNPHEAAMALRQANRLMQKYRISEELVRKAIVEESVVDIGQTYTPPFWVLALANLVADTFECRVFVARHYGRRPEYRFLGLDLTPELATYTFEVLLRQLAQAREDFIAGLGLADAAESERRGDVFAQAWLFRVARTVDNFASNSEVLAAVDAHIQAEHGETVDLTQEPVAPENRDYEDILSGMRAANEVSLFRSLVDQPPLRGLVKALA
ncbi:MAG: DUF2786 domain-containing protein [Thiohalomonadales bacterium]|nr:DUF2786 domain-containing protein [Thiohalomonadales bacterium]